MDKTLHISLDPDILDLTVKDIFKRVAGLEMERVSTDPMIIHDLFSFVTTTHGDYEMTIMLCTDHCVLQGITRHMKHGAEPSGEDIPIYTSEFFNILCGHIVSTLNMKNHCSSRFTIPKLIRGHYMANRAEQCLHEYFYNCDYGNIKIEALL